MPKFGIVSKEAIRNPKSGESIAVRLTLLAILLGLLALPGSAEGSCVLREWLVGELGERHMEQPVARGVTADGALLEILSSDDGRTWTLLVTEPEGLTCTLIEGRDWRQLPEALALNKPKP